MSKQDTRTEPLRRHYAATFKRELVERSLQPGASVSGIALENGINANVLFRWRREHLRATPSVQHESAEQAVLLPVKLAATGTPTGQEAATPRSPMPAGVIEIDIGAARVRLRGAVDEANVRCVLQALRTIA
jgi:transposase